MKIKKLILLILFSLLYFYNTNAQSLFTLNSSYYNSPEITFHNPAPLAIIGKPNANVGIQILHAGFSEDNLRNNYLSYVQPIGSKTAFGLRGQFFTSNIFQRGNFSLLFSQKIYKDILAFGLNANFLTLGYDSDKFELFDFNDPIIENGTSQNTFSLGAGIFLQPVSKLCFGFSIDHLNEPDISINQSGVLKDKVINMGVSYSKFSLIPQVDFQIEGEVLLSQYGIRKSFFNNNLNIFAGYSQFNSSSGSNIFTQAEFKIGDLGVVYNFQYSLESDVSEFSSGSHLFGISYAKGKAKAIILPEISLAEINHDIRQPLLKLSGVASHSDGINYIELIRNKVLYGKLALKKKVKRKRFSGKLLLKEGNNEIEVVAHTKNSKRSERILVSFLPLSPNIQIVSEANIQTRRKIYPLVAQVSDLIGLKKIQIIHNNILERTYSKFSDPKVFDISRRIKLKTGKNDIKIIASNKWKTYEDSIWIYYDPNVAPVLTINSPQEPMSTSSTVVVNVQMENYKKIKKIIFKLNGEPVDTLKVFATRGLAGVRISKLDDSYKKKTTFDIKSANNLIEAIAFDEKDIPRTSNTVNILYNPYANEMRYTKKWAIVVGINKYKDENITDLDLAVSDAETIKKLLKDSYSFDKIYSAYDENTNFENLRALISDTLKNVGANDLVIFYFAGHGDQVTNMEGKEVGFLLPHDAKLGSDSKNISMDYLRRQSLMSPAKHILFIIDVCYGGLGIVEKSSINYDTQENSINFEALKNKTNKRSRNIIAAGGKHEQAVDGLFTRILKNGLKSAADYNNDMYITSTELGLYLKKVVSEDAKNEYNFKQNPQFGSLKVDRGEIVFERKLESK